MDIIDKERKVNSAEKTIVELDGSGVESKYPHEAETARGEVGSILSEGALATQTIASEPGAVHDILPKSQLEKEIEDVLAEDLDNLYWEMPEPERLIFKHKGEDTAAQIRLLLGEATVRVQEIFRLIVEWLKFLPGVSHFFVEQEAKIKTDKLLKFH